MDATNPGAVIVCVDGSEPALSAAKAGLTILEQPPRVVVVTVVEASDPGLVTGAGIAGGVMSSEEFEAHDREVGSEGDRIVADAAAALGVAGAEVRVSRLSAEVCKLAADIDASAIVMGSRGRGGLKRAVLGSVSDHVVRNATCPVVIAKPAD